MLDVKKQVREFRHLVHQVGGEPYLVQRVIDYTMICPSCGKDMPYLATICDDTLDDESVFAGDTFAQIVYHACASCLTIGAMSQVD